MTMQLEDDEKKKKKERKEKKEEKEKKERKKMRKAAEQEAYNKYPWHLYPHPYSAVASLPTYYQPVSHYFTSSLFDLYHVTAYVTRSCVHLIAVD